MKKLESNFRNMFLVLSGITLFAAIILSSLYSATKEPIAKSKLAKEQNAIKEVLPPYHHFDEKPIIINDGVETMKVYKAYDQDNTLVGAAVETTSNNGFSGNIDIMVGFDKVGVIVNYKVLEQHETPGLGTKMVDWFKTDIKNQSIIGKNAGSANLSVTKSGGEIDAITAATVSSKAFLFAVRNAYFAYSNNVDISQLEETQSYSNSTDSTTTSLSTTNNSNMKGQNNE